MSAARPQLRAVPAFAPAPVEDVRIISTRYVAFNRHGEALTEHDHQDIAERQAQLVGGSVKKVVTKTFSEVVWRAGEQ